MSVLNINSAPTTGVTRIRGAINRIPLVVAVLLTVATWSIVAVEIATAVTK